MEAYNYFYVDSTVPEKYKEISKYDLLAICQNRIKTFKRIDLMISQEGDSVEALNKAIQKFKEAQILNSAAATTMEEIQDYWDKDKVAHFFCELIYSQKEEDIIKFSKYERLLFQSRLPSMMIQETSACERQISTLYEHIGIKLQKISNAEWDRLNEKILKANGHYRKEQNQQENYYKTSFQDVLRSVGSLRCYLQKGEAFIHQRELLQSLYDIYESKIQEKMRQISKNIEYLHFMQNDEQMRELIEKIKNLDSDETQISQKELAQQHKLTFQNIHALSKQSFPPCMRYLYEQLHTHKKHFKHVGRNQFQLFQKAAGMTVQDTLTFWKVEFNVRFTDAEFDKKYSYNIRHAYGLEGKRDEKKTAFSCLFTIGLHVGTEEYHGCPFKIFGVDQLKRFLGDAATKEVIELKEYNQFQIACRKVWDYNHPDGVATNFIIENPINYYTESRKYYDQHK